jgi:ADP-dependent NAD(P)H-hydrate dehydratase
LTDGKPLNRTVLKAHPLPPVVDGDKDSKGRLLVVAGSRGVPGAALLTATAAMRAGAGKLRIATIDCAAVALGIAMPEAMVVGLAEGEHGGFAASCVPRVADLAEESDGIIAGPGMQANGIGAPLAQALLQSDARLALDAALLRELEPPAKPRGVTPLLLPHSGELASLLEIDEEAVDRDPIGCGLRAADRYKAIVLVKGVVSHVVTPDGDVWTYKGGAPGLGVSGSGDVLAGITGGLLARGAEPLNALLWSVWLHGEAGSRLAKKIGAVGFLARELADEIPGLLPR